MSSGAREKKGLKINNGKESANLQLTPVHPKPGNDTVQVLLGTPTLGQLNIAWYNAMVGMVTPPNWSLVRSTPVGYTVADAQNMIVDAFLRGPFRALILIEDDTCPPPEAILVFDRWFWKMERKKAPPVVSGVYHIKGSAETRRGKKGGIEQLGPEPLVYRGGGTRAYRDWKYGDVVWVDGVPTGALLLHRSILEAWANEPDVPIYTVPGYHFPLKRIFESPAKVWVEDDGVHIASGTSDLYWSSQTIKRGLLAKAGWPQYQRKQYPYIIDTSLRFGHVDRGTGIVY